MQVDGISDAAASQRTLARLRALVDERGATYLPSHDPQSVARLQALG
jgi:hypothetical protein